jgi:hypothetical protein
MVDRDGRKVATDEIEAQALERQKTHLAALEKLEAYYGFDLDIYTDVFGVQALDASVPESRAMLGRFEKLYEELTGDNPLLCVAGIKQVLMDGCYGFGQEEKYENAVSAAIFEGADNVAVSFIPKTDTSGPSIILSGKGYVLPAEGELPDLENGPYQEAFEIAGMVGVTNVSLTSPIHRLDVIVSDDDGYEVYSALEKARGYHSMGSRSNRVESWAREYWSNRSRMLRSLKAATHETETK